MILAGQGVMEDRIMEEVHSNSLNPDGVMIKETKDNFHKVEEMMIDQDIEIGETAISLNVSINDFLKMVT